MGSSDPEGTPDAIAGSSVVGYLDVVVTQAAALANERIAVEISGRRMVAAVLLVKALGGGWTAPGAGAAQETGDRPDASHAAPDPHGFTGP